jgi:hypothetical protein
MDRSTASFGFLGRSAETSLVVAQWSTDLGFDGPAQKASSILTSRLHAGQESLSREGSTSLLTLLLPFLRAAFCTPSVFCHHIYVLALLGSCTHILSVYTYEKYPSNTHVQSGRKRSIAGSLTYSTSQISLQSFFMSSYAARSAMPVVAIVGPGRAGFFCQTEVVRSENRLSFCLAIVVLLCHFAT